MIDADAVARRPAEQPIDRHAPQLAGDVPQGHVDRRDRVDHERPAAHVAVGAKELLPEMLDPRRVLAVEQFEQRLGQRLRRPRIDPLEIAPAADAVIGFDLHINDRPDPVRLHRRDADARRAVGDLLRGVLLGAHRLIHERHSGCRCADGVNKIAASK